MAVLMLVQLTGIPAHAVLGRTYAGLLEESFSVLFPLNVNYCAKDVDRVEQDDRLLRPHQYYLQAAVSWTTRQSGDLTWEEMH
eukprot:9501404-Pyramimonas_sp.AAC.1